MDGERFDSGTTRRGAQRLRSYCTLQHPLDSSEDREQSREQSQIVVRKLSIGAALACMMQARDRIGVLLALAVCVWLTQLVEFRVNGSE